MLNDAHKAIIKEVDYSTTMGFFYPTESGYTSKLDELVKLGFLSKTALGYVVTPKGYIELFKGEK